MTDNEIIRCLSHCRAGDCENCKALNVCDATFSFHKEAIDLIKRQKAEIESLKHRKTELQIRNQELQHEKSEAIKEFAEKLRNCFCVSKEYLDIVNIIDNLVKEMTEVNENDKT